ALAAPPFVNQYRDSLKASNQRLMSYRSYRGYPDEMPASLTRLWDVPNLGGYNALVLRRMRDFIPMIDGSAEPFPWTEPHNRNLDIMAVRYLFLPPAETSKDERGVSWLKDDAQVWLGSGCNQTPRESVTVTPVSPIRSSSLAVVSRLACAPQVPDGAEVARLRLVDTRGNVETQSLVAGRDTSEWAYDCANIKPYMRHQRARIFRSYPAKMFDVTCEGHFYVTTLPLKGVKEIKTIELSSVSSSIILDKLTLIDDSTHNSFPIDSSRLNNDAWRFV